MDVYVDTCIYLNLWQKEEQDGRKYWKTAELFFEKVGRQKSVIYYSGCILKELQCLLPPITFEEKKKLFETIPFKKIIVTNVEIERARFIEYKTKGSLSFYDIVHMLLAKKVDASLITRDKKLLALAQEYKIAAGYPEDFL